MWIWRILITHSNWCIWCVFRQDVMSSMRSIYWDDDQGGQLVSIFIPTLPFHGWSRINAECITINTKSERYTYCHFLPKNMALWPTHQEWRWQDHHASEALNMRALQPLAPLGVPGATWCPWITLDSTYNVCQSCKSSSSWINDGMGTHLASCHSQWRDVWETSFLIVPLMLRALHARATADMVQNTVMLMRKQTNQMCDRGGHVRSTGTQLKIWWFPALGSACVSVQGHLANLFFTINVLYKSIQFNTIFCALDL